MSAIGGFINFDGQSPDPSVIKRMQSALVPYGRDAQNHICTSNAAFSRVLLRTTPEDALDNQPLIHRSTGTVLVFDGRVDNREELSSSLSIKVSSLKTMADSQIVMQGLIEKGFDLIEKIIGDFALAFWDRPSQTLHLARDAMGIRPLYWHRKGRSFIFATMPKGIFSCPGVAREIDQDTVNNFLCLLPQEGNKSFYKGVQRVQPGHHVTVTAGGCSERVFFDVSKPTQVSKRSDREHIEAVREVTELAVRSRLRASTPVSSELSSGKDSTTVTALAARALDAKGERIHAYTSVPREGFQNGIMKGFHSDEGPGAKAVAAMHPNLDHHFFYLGEQTPLDGLDEFVEAMDRMPLNACNCIWSNGIKKLAASRGSRVLLNGAMGNFTISYDGIYRLPALFLSGKLRTWIAECKAFTRHKRRTNWRSLLRFSAGPLIPKHVWMMMERRAGRSWDLTDYSAINQDIASEHFKKNDWDLSYRPVRDGRKLMAACLQRLDMGDYYAAYNTFGLEVRSPLVDRRVIEVAQSLPESLFFRNGEQSWVLRQAMKDLLPRSVLDARTHGLQAADWFEPMSRQQERLVQAVQELSNFQAAREMMDLDTMDQLVRNWPDSGWESNQVNGSYRLKLLRGLSTGAFIRYVESKNF